MSKQAPLTRQETGEDQAIAKLRRALRALPSLAVAVSGGVDSLTLAVLASKEINQVEIFHAISSAVPASATARVKRLAQQFNWRLIILDAGEMADERYRSNPLNRCYFCKQNLYQAIRSRTELPIAAGTNVDDLSDYRPGLLAADEAEVLHPYVEAGLSKDVVRALAEKLDLGAIAELPASPCLSSRVMTGVSIKEELLPVIDRVEEVVKERFPQCEAVRCRIYESAVVIQLSIECLVALSQQEKADLCASVSSIFVEASGHSYLAENVSIASYMMGSAFDQHSNADLKWDDKDGKEGLEQRKGQVHG